MLVLLLSLVWDWRAVGFQLSGFYCTHEKSLESGALLADIKLLRSSRNAPKVYNPNHAPLVWTPNLTPNTYQLYATYKWGK